MNTRLRAWAVSAVAVGVAAMNLVYALSILQQFLKFELDTEFSQVAISAISAQAGIVGILIWVLANPLVRRGAILAMIPPMLVGNLLYGIHQHFFTDAGVMQLAVNVTFAVLCSLGVYSVWRFASSETLEEEHSIR